MLLLVLDKLLEFVLVDDGVVVRHSINLDSRRLVCVITEGPSVGKVYWACKLDVFTMELVRSVSHLL